MKYRHMKEFGVNDMKDEIQAYCSEFGVNDMKVYLNNNYARQGECFPLVKKLFISKHVYKYNNKEARKSLIGHEIAHLKDVRHNGIFKNEMKRLRIDDKGIIKITKYVIFCPRCYSSFGWNRKELFICKKCYDKDKIDQEMMVYRHIETK